MSDNLIFPAGTALEAFRDGGYKSTANALSEIVDNSIDANAKDIRIFTSSKYVQFQTSRRMRVQEIGVLDDGEGMDQEMLSKCLGFGISGRRDQKDKIGKFGVGMSQASISQCTRIEVYSWQKSSDVYCTYLDIDEVVRDNLQVLAPAKKKAIPAMYKNLYKAEMKDSGTLVLWKNCDRLDISVSAPLYRRMNKSLCRVFRHFLDDDNDLGNQVSIQFDSIEEGVTKESQPLLANDPLYLLTPNNCPGYQDEATNVKWSEGDLDTLEVETEDGETSTVKFIMSIAKPEIQSAGDQMAPGVKTGGQTAYGKHYGDNVGISFVRSGREICLDHKGYFDPKVTTERWWGCEVRFEPVLDSFFGVTNDKQDINDIDFQSSEQLTAIKEDAKDGDPKALFQLEFQRRLDEITRELKKVVSARGGKARSKGKEKTIAEIVNEELEDTEDTLSAVESEDKDEETIINEKIELLLNEDGELEREEARDIAEREKDFRVDIAQDYWSGSTFIDLKIVGRAATLLINTKHKFYEEFYKPLDDMKDNRKPIKALQTILLSYVRAEDQARYTQDADTFEDLREDWGRFISKWIKHSKN
tara:strand:- start:351 stop:2108 length:1758 start_codon:yes stop_codon:yes gene_type:complete